MKRLLLILILVFCSTQVFAQELSPNISVNTENLSAEQKIDIQSLQGDLTNYLAGQRFLPNEWKGDKIPIDINIYITGKSGKYYTAKLLFSSRRKIGYTGEDYSLMTRFLYADWMFPYSMGGASFNFQSTRYNSMSSIIDFYVLLAIGYDLDSYGELDGAPAFSLAQEVALTASGNDAPGFKRFVQIGEFSNLALVNDIVDMRMDDFRKALFSYCVDGLDSVNINKEHAIANVAGAIEDMYYFKKQKLTSPSLSMDAFFDSKMPEICNLFRGKKGAQVFQYLKYLDPGHTSVYNDAEEGKE